MQSAFLSSRFFIVMIRAKYRKDGSGHGGADQYKHPDETAV